MIKSQISPFVRFLSRYVEALLAGFGFIFLYISLAYFVPGGVLGSDVTAYMNLSLNGLEDVSTFYNRYFHILLQRIFLKTAPTPLQGAQFFWAFLIASTCLLIYVNARLFHQDSHPIQSLLAVAIFLSIGAIAETGGNPIIDITAMFIVMVVVTVYLLSARVEHRSKWLVILFGSFFFFAFKTKETTLPVGILVLGLGFTGEKGFNWHALLKNLLYFSCGILVGIVFMAIWSWAALGDPLFGLRPSEFKVYLLNYYSGGQVSGQAQTGLNNWYTGIFFTTLLFPFLLYILSGVKSSALPMTHRLFWLVPLMVILFLSLTIGNRWGIMGRYIFPALPVLCFLGVQFLRFDPLSTDQGRNGAIVLLIVGFGMVGLLHTLMSLLVPKTGWDTTIFLNVILYPFLLTCLLAVCFLAKQPGVKTTMIVFLLIITQITYPLITNFKTMFKVHNNQQAANVVFYPFSTFSKQIVFTPQMHMFISTDTWSAVGNPYFTKNIDEVLDTFNVYFDAASTRNNFTLTSFNLNDAPAVLGSKYTYILLAAANWQIIANDPGAASLVKQNYQVFFDPQNIIVLLKVR